MSRLVQGLERDGLAVREAHESDGRAVLVRATTEGERILARGRERRISELARLFEGLTGEELASLGSAATIIEEALRRPSSAVGAYAASTAERRWSGSG